jgi:collagenase-like PrtC family protease
MNFKALKMEIIAPAGTFQQLKANIDAGADAVYGGMKNWNARTRQKNFEFDEYAKALEYCHTKGSKFYLTLNSLLRDNDLDEIIYLFNSNVVPLPDACIVSDIGLIVKLKTLFPQLQLHSSTLFGSHCVEDLNFLRSIGVSRTVLAREMTFEEIAELQKKHIVELEVFVWGSQCIAFSGDCRLSSLCFGGSADRGKCSGPCRDIYKDFNGNLGNYLYPNDLNAGIFSAKLSKLNISALKIEGRMRPPEETAKVVSQLKELLEQPVSALSYTLSNDSYLNGIIPPKNFLRDCGTEIGPHGTYNNSYTKKRWDHNQVLMLNTHNIDSEIKNSINERVTFAYKLIPGKRAVTLTISNYQNSLATINIVDDEGERVVLNYPLYHETVPTYLSNEELLLHIKGLMPHIHVQEFSINTGSNKKIRVFLDLLRESIIDFAHGVSESRIEFTNNIDVVDYKNITFCVEAVNLDQLNLCVNSSNITVLFTVHRPEDVINFNMRHGFNQQVIFRLSPFDWKSTGSKAILEELIGRRIMITRPRHLLEIKDFKFASVESDYTLDCWNKHSISFIKGCGISRFTGNPEWSLADTIEFATQNKMEIDILSGKLPLLLTRYCWRDTGVCGNKCSSDKILINIEKGYEIGIQCTQEGYSEFFTDKPRIIKDVLRYLPKNTIARIRYNASGMAQDSFIKMLHEVSHFSKESFNEYETGEQNEWNVRLHRSVR